MGIVPARIQGSNNRFRLTISAARFLLLVFGASLGMPPPLPHAALENGSWYRYSSSNFEVYAKQREGEVADRIRSLEAFRAIVHAVVALKDRGNFGHTTKILLLPSTADLRRAFKQPSGVAGFMRPALRENLLVVGKPGSTTFVSENHIAFHEYVHYLVRNASSFRYPIWYDEGFAEMLATVTIGDENAVVGKIPPSAAYILLNLGEMPLARVVQLDSTQGLKRRDAEKFYAKTWLLTHYLSLSGSEQVKRQLLEYLNGFNNGQTSVDAFEKTFRTSFDALESELDTYSRSMPGYHVPLRAIDFNPDYTRVRMSPAEIAYELGYMTVTSNPSYARKLFSRILDVEPDNARALAGMGVSYQFEGDFDSAEKFLRRARALDEGDYLLSIELADLLAIACAARSDSGDCAENQIIREMIALYGRAYELEPNSLETIAHFGTIMIEHGDPQQAVTLLQRALELAPWSYLVVRNLASAYAATGNWARAATQVKKALGWSVDHPEEQARLHALLMQIEIAARLQERQAAN